MRRPSLPSFALAFCAFSFAPWGALRAADDAVALPPFIVEEATKGPPWRFAVAPGYEVLSRCNDAVTRRVVASHQRLHHLLAEMLPPSLQLQCTMPRALILYDEELQPAASREVIARMLQPGAVEPPDDFVPAPSFRGLRAGPPSRRLSFLPNLRLWDRDAMAVFMIVRRDDFDADRLSLTPDYVTFLLKGRVPALPLWFVSGLITLYAQTTYANDRLTLEPLRWISEAHTDAVKNDPKTAPPVQSFEDLLAGRLAPTEEGQSHEPIKAWQAQAALFVRWGLEADGGAHRAALWKFAGQAATTSPTEALFTECFGADFAAVQAQLTAYLPNAVRRTVTFKPAKLPKPAALELRNATDGEIARLKGDWERLEVPFVKNISPDLAPKYLEQARRTLKRAYDRDDRDPRLLAVMGLCEVDAGNTAGARELLEAAAKIGPIRPRAGYELARLRFDEFRAQPAGGDGRLSVNQAAEVLTPLFAARAQQPPLAEVYALIADVWAAVGAKPTRGHLAVLDEGVRLFPRRGDLSIRAAELFLREGFREEATTYLRIAALMAGDDATRARVALLQNRMEKTD
jgi:hypothetical protein